MRRCLVVVLGVLLASAMLRAQQPTIWPVTEGVRTQEALGGRLKVRLVPGIPRGAEATALKSMGLTKLYQMLPWELSVTARSGKGASTPQDQEELNSIVQLEEPLLRTFVVTYEGSLPPEKIISMLRPGCSLIDVCEPVYLDRIQAVPDDPLLSEQAMLATIKAYEGWDVQPGSDTVIIGISDSGVFQDHEDLTDALFVRAAEIPDNGIDDDGNGYIDDHRGYNFCTNEDGTPPGNTFNKTEGHGTGVAGICGASVNNGIGVAGVANRCKILPLKTMPDNIPGIVYGYESIMYCALNGIHVVNCSWGGSSRSCINESVIAYAVARNVAIVAASGNHGTSAPFYPGSYTNVLSVGVTDPEDNVIGMTGHGPTTDIMAPGQGTYTTSNDGTYGGFCCTSGSSPIVAAVVALVLSETNQDGTARYTAREACAVVKESADPVEWASVPDNVDARLLPKGRVDVLRALEPESDLRSVEVVQVSASSTANDTRWASGDTVRITVSVRNDLEPFTAERLLVQDLVAGSQPALLIDTASTIEIGSVIDQGETFDLPQITAVVLRDTDTTEFVVTSIETSNASGQPRSLRATIPLTPAPAFRTLSNTVLTLSVGDRARIGNTDLAKGQGEGITYGTFCGQLYEGGLMVTANGRVVDAVRGVRQTNDHFYPSKRFTRPKPLTGIVTDADAPDSQRIGVEITQNVRIASADSGLFIVDVTIRNVSDSVLTDVALGWFYDWDLGIQPVENSTLLHSVSARESVQRIVSTTPGEPRVLVASISHEFDAQPVSAGLDNTATYGGILPETKRGYLTNGTDLQYTDQNDVAVVNGMRFMAPMSAGQTRTFRHVIAIDHDLARAEQLLDAARSDYQVRSPERLAVVYPNPASLYARVEFPAAAGNRLTVSDMEGRRVMEVDDPSGDVGSVNIDVSGLASGLYQVRLVTSNGTVQTTPLVVLR